MNGDGRTSVRAGYALTYDLPDFKTVHSPNTTWSGLAASAGAMTNPDLGVFSVSLNGTQTRAPDAAGVTCINPNTPNAGGNFDEIKFTVGVGAEEFGVSDSAHETEAIQ